MESDLGNIFQIVYDELTKFTKTKPDNRQEIAQRIVNEVRRICAESKRIQASGEVESWMRNLARLRVQQTLKYYKLGSKNGRVELHSTLSAIVYRYVTLPLGKTTYQARLNLIEDFLQSFYAESLNAFRREHQVAPIYTPKTLLELAEYMAFSERYGKRRIPLPGNRSQQLIILRAQTFSQQQPSETSVDIEIAANGSQSEHESSWVDPLIQQVREAIAVHQSQIKENSLQSTIVQELIHYLEDKEQKDCADYFSLRLQDLSASEIEEVLGLTPRQRDYLQQRFKYHLVRFAFSHQWELVHSFLEADLDGNLGLTRLQWEDFQKRINPIQTQLLNLKQKGLSNQEIANRLKIAVSKVEKSWFKLLEMVWEIRNRSGVGNST